MADETVDAGGAGATPSETTDTQPGSGGTTVETAPNPPAPDAGANPGNQGGAGGNPQAAAPQLQTDSAASTATIPEQQTQSGPLVLKQLPHTGVRGMLDRVLDAISGGPETETYVDENGQQWQQHPDRTTGQKWLKVGMEALHGAATGMAAGRGAGNGGKAALAGWQAGEQDQQQAKQADQDNADRTSAQIRQRNIDKANSQIVQTRLAADAFRLTREQKQADQEDMKFANDRTSQLQEMGATTEGSFDSFDDFHNQYVKKNGQAYWDAHMKDDNLEAVPNISADGTRHGVTIWKKPDGAEDMPADPGTQYHEFQPPTKPGEPGRIVAVTPASDQQFSRRWIKTMDQHAMNEYTKWRDDELKAENTESEIGEHQATTAKTKAETANVPAEGARVRAQTAEATASAAHLKAETDKITNGTATGGLPPEMQTATDTLAKMLISGDLLPGDLKGRSASVGINPNLVMARAKELADQSGQQFSPEMLKMEAQRAGDKKTVAAVQGIDTMLGTATQEGQLDKVIRLATAAGLGDNAPLNTVEQWWARTRGENAAKDFKTALIETQRAVTPLIGNTALGGGDSDLKLKQAQEAFGSNPTLGNIKSTAATLKDMLTNKRATLVDNNRYLKRTFGATQNVRRPGSQPDQGGTPAQNSGSNAAPSSNPFHNAPVAQ